MVELAICEAQKKRHDESLGEAVMVVAVIDVIYAMVVTAVVVRPTQHS